MSGAMPERRTAIFLSHADDVALRVAGSCALAAAAMGDRVEVYLFGPAVRAVVAAHGDLPDEPGRRLHEAREAGRCRVVACSESVVVEKVPLTEAEAALDAVVGWPTILDWTRGVVERFFF
jgi:predicted peroxiredoxin